MKRYPEDDDLDKDELDLLFTKYTIVVPTDADKQDLMEAFKAIHDSRDLDNSYVPVNQLMHEYQPVNSIVVSQKAFDIINELKKAIK
jgi:hypothetical protein